MPSEPNEPQNGAAPDAEDQNQDMRTMHAGETPLPQETDGNELSEPKVENEAPAQEEVQPDIVDQVTAPEESIVGDVTYLPRAPMSVESAINQHFPLRVNQLAIINSAQNKLPVDKVKAIVCRLSRHTESSGHKAAKWYKSETYVDKDTYTWKNMALFDDHQTHLWKANGTVRDSYKK